MRLTSALSTITIVLATVSSTIAGSCPDGKDPSLIWGTPICCPGMAAVDACLVGCSLTESPCFPLCEDDSQNDMSTSGVCTTIPYGVADYTSKVYAAASGAPVANKDVSTTGTVAGGATHAPSVSRGGAAAPAITEPPILALAGAMAAYALF